ncbi:unnamed protein product [Notodromas monacha]|uniref:C2H2-type domain-containing protein n=1 Tax=Notodromas monacha TaxID=399045 RepID=A0A7R9GI70_9CRUS|nr:unnamed protein product [Notodromas monacha]CAG0923562.1 unnamed protein product [Notodromas monacha]
MSETVRVPELIWDTLCQVSGSCFVCGLSGDINVDSGSCVLPSSGVSVQEKFNQLSCRRVDGKPLSTDRSNGERETLRPVCFSCSGLLNLIDTLDVHLTKRTEQLWSLHDVVRLPVEAEEVSGHIDFREEEPTKLLPESSAGKHRVKFPENNRGSHESSGNGFCNDVPDSGRRRTRASHRVSDDTAKTPAKRPRGRPKKDNQKSNSPLNVNEYVCEIRKIREVASCKAAVMNEPLLLKTSKTTTRIVPSNHDQEINTIFGLTLDPTAHKSKAKSLPGLSMWFNFRCRICAADATNAEEFVAHHASNHSTVSLFKCHFCFANFDHAEDFQNHVYYEELRKTCRKEFVCKSCNEDFMNPRRLSEHFRKVHALLGQQKENSGNATNLSWSPFRCDACPDVLIDSFENYILHRTAEWHMNEVHFKCSPYVCTTCAKSYPSKLQLRLHMEYHKPKAEKLCPICGKSVKGFLAYHVSAVHNREKRLKCDLCDERFMHYSAKKKHLARVHDVRASAGAWEPNPSLILRPSKDIF